MGCNSEPKPLPIFIPANLKSECEVLVDSKPVNIGELLQADIELIRMYGECANKHKALIEVLDAKQ